MNKKEIYKELSENWNLFSMNEKESQKAYYEITGLEPEEMSLKEIKEYILNFLLEQMLEDKDITEEQLIKIKEEMHKIERIGG